MIRLHGLTLVVAALSSLMSLHAAVAQSPSGAMQLELEDLSLLGELDGQWPAAPLPLAGLVGPLDAEQRPPALEHVQAAGLVDSEGRLSELGSAVWICLARPEVAIQIRRYSATSVGAVWYLAGPQQAWRLAAQKDFVYDLAGPYPRSALAETIATAVSLPTPVRSAELNDTFSLAEMLLLQTIARELFVFSGLEGLGRPALGLTLDEIANYMVVPARMDLLASDPTFDLAAQWPSLSEPGELQPVVEALAHRGWIAAQRSTASVRFDFTERGRALQEAVLNAGASIQVTCVRRKTEEYSAATGQVCVSKEQLVVLKYRPSRHDFMLRSLPPADPKAALVTLINELVEEAGTAPSPTTRGAEPAPAAESAPAASQGAPTPAEPPRPTTMPSDPLGGRVRDELSRGVYRTGGAKTFELWARGKPDLWVVDSDGDGAPDVEYEDTDGDGEPDFVRVRDVPAQPFTRSFIRRQAKWEESNILEAFLEINFKLPWDRSLYHKHNVNVILNDQVVAQLTDVIPDGRYRFRLRPQVLRVNALGAERNQVCLETSHLRGGHYLVCTDFRLIMKLSQVSRHVVATGPEEARAILAARGNLITSGVDLSIYVNEWRVEPAAPQGGETVKIGGLIHNDGHEPASGWKLCFYEGDPARGGKRFDEQPLPVIEEGGFVVAAAKWIAQPGDHQLVAVLVPPEGYKDVQEDNNQVRLPVRGGGDTEPPSLFVTRPTDNDAALGPSVTFAGTAKDNAGLASLEFSVDGGLWQPIEIKERWEAAVPLSPGKHVVRVRLRDTSGLEGSESRTITVK